jgi:hypothetical protein
MHLHRPKPVHGLREILTEIGVVVVGIAIALGGEQALTAWHDHELVAHGESALKANFTMLLRWNAELEATRGCVADRAREVRAILDAAGARHELPRVGPIPKPVPHPWEVSAWDEMVASQAASHIPPDQAFLIAGIAHSARNAQVFDYGEVEAWSELGALSGPPRHFSEAEEASLRAALARAQNQSDVLRIFGPAIQARILRTGLVDQQAAREAAGQAGLQFTSKGRYPMCAPIEVSSP